MQTLPAFAVQHEAMALVTDFSPLRVGLGWARAVAGVLDETPTASGSLVPLVQVDAHNVVPCWETSPKQEYGARTIRSKIQARLAEFLTPQPALQHNPTGSLDCDAVDWEAALEELQINRSIGQVDWIDPGTAAGYRMLDTFIGKH